MTQAGIPGRSALDRIVGSGLIAVVRGIFPIDRLLRIAETLQSSQIDVVEVTLNSKDALGHISSLRKLLPMSTLVGAGTVCTSADLEFAAQAGAEFAIGPNIEPEALITARRLGILMIPGVLTPTEVHMAGTFGCEAVKLFPANSVGPEYLKSLRAVFGDMKFIPTGGVTCANLGAYRRAGAAAAGIGSALVTTDLNDDAGLAHRASAIRAAWDRAL